MALVVLRARLCAQKYVCVCEDNVVSADGVGLKVTQAFAIPTKDWTLRHTCFVGLHTFSHLMYFCGATLNVYVFCFL